MAGYICKIVIENTHPPVWRRAIIPERITFQELHEIIQVLFGWEDDHLHGFQIPSDHICIDFEDCSWGNHYNEGDTLIDPFFRNYKWIRYTYDFGDNWQHRINIEQKEVDYDKRCATLMKFKGDDFQEDVGHIWSGVFDERRVFVKENVEKRLENLSFSQHKELTEERLLKEALSDLSKTFQAFGKRETNASKMAEKVEKWKDFYRAELIMRGEISLTASLLSQKELLMDLGEKEASDYYKYLRLPQGKYLSREEKVDAVSKTLHCHPEYLFYIFDDEEYQDLKEMCGYLKGKRNTFPKSESVIIKMLVLGLADFKRTEDSAEICLAADIDRLVDVTDAKTKRSVYKELQVFDERLGDIILVYGIMNLEELYDLYQTTFQKDIDKETLFRYVYWHSRFNNFVDTFYKDDGSCYVAGKAVDAQDLIEKQEQYSAELPYQVYSAKELTHLSGDLSNRSEWVDTLFTTLHYHLKMDLYEAQDTLIEIITDIVNGSTVGQVVAGLQNQKSSGKSLGVKTELWTVIVGLMLEIELPMLKGRSRLQYAREQHVSPWSVGMLTEDAVFENTNTCPMYQFPSEIQEWMYEAVSDGSLSALRWLINYGEKNQISSEEYLYLLAETCIVFGEEDAAAKKLIRKLKTSSHEGKKGAKRLEEMSQERYDVMDDDFNLMNPWGVDEAGWEDRQQPYVRTEPKIGRNDPCPCGSGKKYKKCCGRK